MATGNCGRGCSICLHWALVDRHVFHRNFDLRCRKFAAVVVAVFIVLVAVGSATVDFASSSDIHVW